MPNSRPIWRCHCIQDPRDQPTHLRALWHTSCAATKAEPRGLDSFHKYTHVRQCYGYCPMLHDHRRCRKRKVKSRTLGCAPQDIVISGIKLHIKQCSSTIWSSCTNQHDVAVLAKRLQSPYSTCRREMESYSRMERNACDDMDIFNTCRVKLCRRTRHEEKRETRG